MAGRLVQVARSSLRSTTTPLSYRSFIRTFTSSSPRMGVEVKNIADGDGKNFPKKGGTVTMHYVGTLANGTKFDSSRDRGKPFVTEIGIGRVIKGWDEGVPQLSLGQKAILVCSADYAYGPRGVPGAIPPNATLNFEVELLKIN
ncbi:hypothetical protein DACRYDRAFT_19947 [Dacryopinax primogenitus]|uniref:peptidylprolyl isomerase n=1 Tax=Dacryopinax primogenitus (strain DJM 731) TaxID=1858805 RepID=M5GAQ6_DACPD|nr:uncharacterized protein DACRYDRAFT_19947 [Dacryopinax primogenitus]EJU05455.1 hypothetical protein DACRYDRAFT_19947 [Dacryopinax primogenitus]